MQPVKPTVSEDTVTIELNGTTHQARRGAMIIEIADSAGVLVPRFCYHKKLSVAANCRMCLVEVEKAPKPLPACATPVMEGMKIHTHSALALKAQKSVMEFLLINHPLDCPICDQGGECELQDIALGYGRDVSRFNERKRVVKDKNIGPLIATDMTRCIHCTRCVRFGEEIAGMPELGVTGRGEFMEIGTFIEQSVDSELSGNVIDVCPVGALTSKPFRYTARTWEMKQHDAVSAHDAVGSNLYLHVKQERIMRVVPRENELINEVWISDRDRFSYQGLYHPERLRAPRIKREGGWQEVDWQTALDFAAQQLSGVCEREGARGIGALVSPSATSEEHYLLQKLMRGLGTQNIDHRTRECDFSDQERAPLSPGLGQSLVELETVEAVLLIGSFPRHEHPLVNHRIRKAALNGARVSAINPIDYPFNFELEHKIVCSPAVMVNALAGVASALGVPGIEAGGRFIGTEVEERSRHIAERLSAAKRAAIVLGPSANAHPSASALRGLGAGIAEASGATLGFLSEGANAAGAWLAGAVPHRFPGGGAVPAPGLTAGEMVTDGLKGWVVVGVEPELDCHDSAAASHALDSADLVVCLTAYRSLQMDSYANVLLPIAAGAENAGTYVNLEGRWQSFEAAVRPLGDSRPAWKVLRVLGNLLELEGFEYVEPAEIRDELKSRLGDATMPAAGDWEIPAELPRSNGVMQRVGDVPMYAVDAIVRRASALQRTVHARDAEVRVNRVVASRLGIDAGDRARVAQGGAVGTLNVVIDPSVPDDSVQISAGVAGSIGLGPCFGAIEVKKL